MKSMMALAAATVIVTSAFMQPAASQTIRKGNSFSLMGGDGTPVVEQFTLVDTDKNGNAIKETEETKKIEPPDLLSFFPRAIENYKQGSLGRACSPDIDIQAEICNSYSSILGGYYVDSSGFVIIDYNDNSGIIPFDGDLKAELIVNDPLFGGRNTIAYTIFKVGEVQPVQRYRLDFSAFNFSQERAINDLTYILQQNLFSEARSVVSVGGIEQIGYGVSLHNSFEEEIKTVPESSATTALLSLGVLGAILVLKNKIISI
ncbi:hypothetical protein IQ276_007915 [Desmonostoc muscorum LEGE 12446]|uniref:PEP-CTERM sorting domain-containing protein n=1 Tax=Desmonostoc muscorum LEGE 12446 TaxID=1828758 RepID=A0A8J7CZH8_DESMC|nr:hypothetical protein [Desmonostoc muscorum]MCF2146375.1 hypothetical protein [Desmonostoc muscorum LEGE 12446]